MKTLHFTIILFLFSFSSSAQNWNKKGIDVDGDAAGDNAGWSVSMPDGNTVAIGARFNHVHGTNSGQAFVVRWVDGSWNPKGGAIYGDAPGDYCGYSVSMPDSNTLAVGLINNGVTGNKPGHVRIYKWNGSSWVQKGNDIEGEADDDNSGHSISMPDSNTIAIGAPNNDGNGNDAGHTRIYSWNGNAWVQKGMDIDGEDSNDCSGWSVSMPDSNTVAIGSYLNDANGINAGHVRIYSWNGSAWIQKGIDIDGEAQSNDSGHSVSMSDSNTVAIGAPRNTNANGTASGHVRIYSWDGNAWAQKGMDLDGESQLDKSGWSVSMPDSNFVAIGAQANNGGGGASIGHVRVYRWDGIAWVQIGNDIDGEATGDCSGWSVSMPDTNFVAIGARWNDGTGPDAGHARIYSFCINYNITTIFSCDSYTSPSGNHIWTSNGIYTDTIANMFGCDSIITIYLNIKNSSLSTININSCYSYTSPSGNYSWQTSGSYLDTLTNAVGCDSIITINLTIDTVNTTVTNNSTTLTATAAGAGYQWVDCNNNFAIINGATSQSFTPSVGGNYAVIITQNNCIDTSACESMVFAGILENNFDHSINLFPNPTTRHLQIDFGNYAYTGTVTIYNLLGQQTGSIAFDSQNSVEIDIEGEEGIYLIKVESLGRKALLKVVKK